MNIKRSGARSREVSTLVELVVIGRMNIGTRHIQVLGVVFIDVAIERRLEAHEPTRIFVNQAPNGYVAPDVLHVASKSIMEVEPAWKQDLAPILEDCLHEARRHERETFE